MRIYYKNLANKHLLRKFVLLTFMKNNYVYPADMQNTVYTRQ